MSSVKTRVQLEPLIYNRGLTGGVRQIVVADGASALLTGLGPTATGYFLQGAFKFGGYEFFVRKYFPFLNLVADADVVNRRRRILSQSPWSTTMS